MKRLILTIALGIHFIHASPAAVVDATWTGLGGNNAWNDPDNWITPAGGHFVPSNNGNAFRGFIDNDPLVNAGVTLGAGLRIADLTLDEGDTLTIESGFSLGLETNAQDAGGGLQNAGLILIDGSTVQPGNNTHLRLFEDDAILSGGGTIRLIDAAEGDNAEAWITDFGAETLTNVDNTIEGGGNVLLGLINQANGRINANQPGEFLNVNGFNSQTPFAPNAGVMEASDGGTLNIRGDVENFIDSDLGLIRANDGSTVNVFDHAIRGGELVAQGSGRIELISATLTGIDIELLDSSTLTVTRLGAFANARIEGGSMVIAAGAGLAPEPNQILRVRDGFTLLNDGTVTLATDPGGPAVAQLIFEDDFEITGSGELLMEDDSSAPRLIGNGSGANLIHGPSHTIRGAGLINSVSRNQGVIQADGVEPLELEIGNADATENTGVYRAVNGGTLEISGTGAFNRSFINNAGGLVQAQAGSTVRFDSSANFLGGEINTLDDGVIVAESGSVENATLSATIEIPESGLLELVGDIVNIGAITLQAGDGVASLLISGTVNLTGGGVIELTANDNNHIFAGTLSDDPDRLINVDNTIRGQGVIGDFSLVDFINQGVLQATESGALRIAISQGAAEWTNTGVVEALGAGGVDNPTDFENQGTVTIAAGSEWNGSSAYLQSAGETIVNGTFRNDEDLALQGGTLKGEGVIDFGDSGAGALVQSGGALAPGASTGQLTIEGDYEQNGGALAIELGGLEPGTEYDVLNISGSATLGGPLEISLIDGFADAIQDGDSFTVLNAGSLTGTFSEINITGAPAIAFFEISDEGGQITLTYEDGILTYAEWQGDHFDLPAEEAIAGFLDNPDHDELPNGLEFVSGRDPLAFNHDPLLIQVGPGPDATTISGSYRMADAAVGAMVGIWESADLETWSPADLTVDVTPSGVPGISIVSFLRNAPLPAGEGVFLQMRATQEPD